MSRRNRIPIKSPREIEKMREAGQAASRVLQDLIPAVQPGVATQELDRYSLELMEKHGCKSTVIGYRGFPGHICISLNEEVVHGIGGARKIQPGDIVKLDVTVTKAGFIGDNCSTIPVGEISPEISRLLAVTEEALYRAIGNARAGVKLAEVCGSVEDFIQPRGFSVVREFVGHGVGRRLHEEPQVPNYRMQGKSPTLLPGMTLAIEPMVNAGRAGIRILEDGWTVITEDRKPSAHFEHTVLVTSGDPEILTDRPRIALPEQLGLPAW